MYCGENNCSICGDHILNIPFKLKNIIINITNRTIVIAVGVVVGNGDC